jgi:hypothetical protein
VWLYLSGRPPGDGSAEAGFARAMMVHHAQAVGMAEIVRDKTENEDVRILATDIALTQQAQIGQMQGWLAVERKAAAHVYCFVAHVSKNGHTVWFLCMSEKSGCVVSISIILFLSM